MGARLLWEQEGSGSLRGTAKWWNLVDRAGAQKAR